MNLRNPFKGLPGDLWIAASLRRSPGFGATTIVSLPLTHSLIYFQFANVRLTQSE
jgi:hypothetical protein